MEVDVATRFWTKVNKHGSIPEHKPELGPCWEWIAGKFRYGYGQFTFQGRNMLAHRVSWFLKYGKFPQPMGLHKCDNPSCVRPTHLFEGTKDDNMKDQVSKNRSLKGEKHPRAKLTSKAVGKLREKYNGSISTKNAKDEAIKYRVHEATIKDIVYGYSWHDPNMGQSPEFTR
jgi:hypothetical protein